MPKTDKTTAITGDSVYKMAKAYAKKARTATANDILAKVKRAARGAA